MQQVDQFPPELKTTSRQHVPTSAPRIHRPTRLQKSLMKPHAHAPPPRKALCGPAAPALICYYYLRGMDTSLSMMKRVPLSSLLMRSVSSRYVVSIHSDVISLGSTPNSGDTARFRRF